MLVLLDIDGTILSSNNKINKKTKMAIKKVSRMNRVILISARKPSSVIAIKKQIELDEKVIVSYNGALVMNGCKKILEHIITLDQFMLILQMAQKYNVCINIYSGNSWFVDNINEYIVNESKIINEDPLILKKDNCHHIHKILLICQEEKLKCIERELKEIKNINVNSSKDNYLEITSGLASKKKAFKFLLEYLSVDIENTLVIGDGYNDKELIELAGIGVAMGNAPLEVKNVADYVTDSNDNNGVAYALQKIFGEGG